MVVAPTRPAESGVDSTDPLYLGLISGTSADGIDVALVRFEPRLQLIFARTCAWEPSLRERLVQLGQQSVALALEEVGELDTQIGLAFGHAARQALLDSGTDAARVAAIGSHGQTLRHCPHGPAPFTLQLGDPNCIAEITRCMTVADFRRRDVAAGGHGAPLMPAFHAATLGDPAEPRAVLNLGGIANLTLLAPGADVRGFDTGPANGLMDAWCTRHTGQAFDRDGAFARSGRVDQALLSRLLSDPWLQRPAPKSTGRDHFHLGWLDAQLTGESPEDVQATLVALSASSIVGALKTAQPGTRRVIACGGGVHNPVLMDALASALATIPVESSAAFGMDPDFVEAMGFAWLARETLAGRAGNLPSVSGARGPRVLGAIYAA